MCCQTGGIVRDSASDILYGLTHIGMSGSRLYNQGVRRALRLQPPPCSPSARIALITVLRGLERPSRTSTRSLTVDMTVDVLMVKRKARVYAGLQPSEMIEWE